MKASTLLAGLCFAAATSAWKLEFYGYRSSKHVKASGKKDVDCNNLISSYKVRTDFIDFDQETSFYKDPSTFTAYELPDCEGKSFTGNPGRHTISPPRRFRSYHLH